MQQKEKKRDRALLLLLLLLLYITGTVMYYYKYPHEGNKTVVKRVAVEKPVIMNTQDTLLMDTIAMVADSVTIAIRPIDTGVVINTDPGPTQPIVIEQIQPAEDNLAEIENMRRTRNQVNISTDGDIVCYYDAAKKHLSFYPTKTEWDKVYLIYPSPDAKSLLRRNLLYPDFEGMVYPIYRKGFMVYKGVKETAVAVRINAKADRKRSYVIQAKSNPQYFIFGDYEDKNRWYIFENGQVNKFNPPSDFDAGLTEKL